MRYILISAALLGIVTCTQAQESDSYTLTAEEKDSYVLVNNADIDLLYAQMDRMKEIIGAYEDKLQEQKEQLLLLETACKGQKI